MKISRNVVCDACNSIMFKNDLVAHIIIGRLDEATDKGVYFDVDKPSFHGNVHVGCIDDFIDSGLWEQDTKGTHK